jgi:hypothetical protein
MLHLNLHSLGTNIQWSEEYDHAKLAISDKDLKKGGNNRWVCVGDLNYTQVQEKRSRGTVAFISEPLWSRISSILETVEAAPKKASV